MTAHKQGQPLDVTPATAPDEADAAKKWYFNSTVQPLVYGEAAPPYARIVADCVASMAPASVLEFGCNAGRNLHLLRASLSDARLLGIDVNPLAVEQGKKLFGLDLRVGDETALAEFREAEIDVSFTVSVLDHIPDIASISRELVRITGHALVLLEITHSVDGKVVTMADESGKAIEGYPFSYFHNYRKIFEETLGCPCLLDAYVPVGTGNLLELYRLYVFATREPKSSGICRLRRIELEPMRPD